MENKKNGFTLLELQVAIVIIAILAAFLIPAVLQAKKKTRQKECAYNLKEIGRGLILYQERFDSFPEVVGNACLIRLHDPNVQLLPEESTFLCPVRGGGTIRDNYLGPNEPLVETMPVDRPIAGDALNNHGTGTNVVANVLLFDTSVQISPDQNTIFNGRINWRNYVQL